MPRPALHYGSQITGVALLTAAAAYLSIALELLRPGIWNIAWMVGIPAAIGVSLNRGTAAAIMAVALPAVSWVTISIVGTVMGGI